MNEETIIGHIEAIERILNKRHEIASERILASIRRVPIGDRAMTDKERQRLRDFEAKRDAGRFVSEEEFLLGVALKILRDGVAPAVAADAKATEALQSADQWIQDTKDRIRDRRNREAAKEK